MSQFTLVQEDVAVAMRSRDAHVTAMAAFEKAAEIGDWQAAETHRLEAVSAMEAFLDAIVRGRRRMLGDG